MSIAFLLPFLCVLVFLVVVARTTFFRARPHRIDHVVLFVRKLDVSDLELLLDAGEEWALRQSLTREAFRSAQEDRIRLLREYLHRVAHNVQVIQLWVAREYELIKDKDQDAYTEKDTLVHMAFLYAQAYLLYSLFPCVQDCLWTA